MPNSYPFYSEPQHDQGSAITLSATNAGRDTGVSSAEQRLIVDAVDKIFLREPKLIGFANSNIGQKNWLYAGNSQEAKFERISTNGQSAGNLRKQRVLNDYTPIPFFLKG